MNVVHYALPYPINQVDGVAKHSFAKKESGANPYPFTP